MHILSCRHLKYALIWTLCGLGSFCHGQSAEALRVENQTLRKQLGEIKKDTAALRLELRFCKALERSDKLEIKGISNDIQIRILSCLGDNNTQMVKIEFVVSHKLVNQEVCVAADKKNIKAYDRVGNEIAVKAGDIGINAEGLFTPARCNKVPTDVPVKGNIILSSVLPSTNMVGFLSVGFKYRNHQSNTEYTYGTLEIKNLEIKW